MIEYFRDLPPIGNYEIIGNHKDFLQHYYHYGEFAKKGLYCFDKEVLNNYDNTIYKLIVKPENTLNIKHLPNDILSILQSTSLDLELKYLEKLDVNLID